jgi:glycosyltransferase involved in cell wall biosynthesis
MNKNNAEGLRKALETLAKQVECRICECFDILIIDGHSEDDSSEVARKFSEIYPCVTFKMQEIQGGVGPARLEAVKYAIDKGYKYIIWGDSENEYTYAYVANIKRYLDGDCDIVSGKSVIKDRSIWSRMFFWYHTYHLLFSYVAKRHAPGNNKGVKVDLYQKYVYPPTSRSDDFYFSYITEKEGLRYCVNDDAVIKVSMPNLWREVLGWQRARVKGLVEGALILGRRLPPDFLPWFGYLIAPFIALAFLMIGLEVLRGGLLENVFIANALGFSLVSLFILYALGIAGLLTKLVLLSRKLYGKYRFSLGILGLIGMYLHAVFTTYYSIKHYMKLRGSKPELINRTFNVLQKFGFRLEQISRGGD